MRIAFFAKRKRRTRTTRSIAAALRRAGHELLWVNERGRRRLVGQAVASAWSVRQVSRFRPDVVLVHSNDISLAALDALAVRYRTALFTPDCWQLPLGGTALERARRVEILLTVARGQIPAFEAAGVRRAAYLAEACDPSLHYPVDSAGAEWSSEVAFIGRANAGAEAYAARSELVRAVHARFETKLYGSGWAALGLRAAREDVGPEHYRRICRGAAIVLGRDWTTSCAWYFSNRTWFTLGCGGFLLTNHVPGLEEIFTNHRELVWYRSEAECLELIERYRARPEERRRIAAAGRAFVLAHRTPEHFARDLTALLDGKPAAFPPARAEHLA